MFFRRQFGNQHRRFGVFKVQVDTHTFEISAGEASRTYVSKGTMASPSLVMFKAGINEKREIY